MLKNPANGGSGEDVSEGEQLLHKRDPAKEGAPVELEHQQRRQRCPEHVDDLCQLWCRRQGPGAGTSFVSETPVSDGLSRSFSLRSIDSLAGRAAHVHTKMWKAPQGRGFGKVCSKGRTK